MKILTKYIVMNFWRLFLLFFLSFIMIFIIVDLFDNLDDLLQYDITARELFYYYLNFVPPVIVQTIPVAVLLSVISLFRRLSSSNEYVAMVGGGFSLTDMLKPLAVSIFCLSIFSFIVSDYMVPGSYFRQQKIKAERFYRADHSSKKILQKLYMSGKENQLVFIRSYDIVKKAMQNIVIIESGKDNLLQRKIIAAEGDWRGDGWVFKNVTVYDYSRGYISEKVETLTELFMDINTRPEDLILSKNTPDFMSTRQLKALSRRLPDENSDFRRILLVEYHYRYAFSFVGLVLLFVAVAFGLIQKRGPALLGVGAGILIGLFYYVLLSILLSFGKGGFLPPFVAAWGANFIFLIFSSVMIYITPK